MSKFQFTSVDLYDIERRASELRAQAVKDIFHHLSGLAVSAYRHIASHLRVPRRAS